jgi:hypothetical protein
VVFRRIETMNTTNTMNTIGKLLAISTLVFGCASTQVGQRGVTELRGRVVVAEPSVRAIVAGPADIHAYSEFAGGTLYTVPAVAGDSRDCASARRDLVVLDADRVRAFRVEPGSVACLATVTNRRFELLWHGHRPDVAPGTLVAVSGR